MYISIKNDSIAQYWETPKDFFISELKAYVNDIGQVVIPAPYYAKDKKDWVSAVSYDMDKFTKEEAMNHFSKKHSADKIAERYFYKLNQIKQL